MKIRIANGFESLSDIINLLACGELPQDAVCIYPGRRNQLYRFATPMGDMVVKRFGNPSLINSLVYTNLRKSKAERSFYNSLHLQRLGIGVPQPVAYGEQRVNGRLHESFYLCRAVKGDTIRFYEMRPDCDSMLAALARDMLRFHLLGVLHKDFSPGNVLVERTDSGEYRFNYVDLNRMAFDVYEPEKQLEMFSRINYSEMHTLRLARAYATQTDFSGLFPLLRPDTLRFGSEERILSGASHGFFHFWQRKARLHRLKHFLLHR